MNRLFDKPVLRKVLAACLLGAGALIARAIQKKKNIRYKHAIILRRASLAQDDPERGPTARGRGPSRWVDLLTETDRQAEEFIIRLIRRHFPGHDILAEESGFHAQASLTKWIVDPLDGTTNFAHRFPHCCVSIAVEHRGEVLLGGVYDPFRRELFWAEKGKGAFLNRKRIRASTASNLRRALLTTGFPYDRWERSRFYMRFFEAFMKRSHGTRRLGAAALDLAYVACGRFDGFWEWNLNPWDVAAGKLLVEEAGGRVTDFQGKPYSIYGRQTLASNGRIHGAMIRVLRSVL